MLEYASPPRKCPTIALHDLISFSVIEPSFIRFAASINNGTANNVKLFIPLNIFVKTTALGICGKDAIPTKETTPNANDIGTPIATHTINKTTKRAAIILSLLS
jgi:hypothetical protein